jgi:hypothetical protein
MAAAKKTTSDPEAGRIVSIKDLAARVEELAGKVGGGGKPAGGPDVSRETPAPGNVDEQVNRAIEAAKQREAEESAKQAEKKAVDDRIKALEERAERRPNEHKWFTRFMWGGPE